MVRTRYVDIAVLTARGRFAIDMPVGARVVSSVITTVPTLNVRLYVELPSAEETLTTTDGAGLLVVQYVRRRVDLRRRRFVLDGRGTSELSVRELRVL